MKTRKLSDAAIVAALLLTSLADPTETSATTRDDAKIPALRKPSTYIPLTGAPYAPGAAPAGRV
ncbi:MAG: hypothetical protein IJE07_08195 [Clostridia bacterium]|nr:hypothetical protein [Clostridia bacterium]